MHSAELNVPQNHVYLFKPQAGFFAFDKFVTTCRKV